MTEFQTQTYETIKSPEHEQEDYFDYFFDEPGSEPGTLSIDQDAQPSTIILIDYNQQEATRKLDITPKACQPYLETNSVSWVDIQGLGSENILKEIGQVFSLHDLLLEDVVNVPQRPKVEQYKENLLILVQMVIPKKDEWGFENEQVSFVLGMKYLLTFQEKTAKCFEPVRERIRNNKGKVRELGPDYLAYVLLDAVIDSYFPVLEHYGERIEDLEDRVVQNPNNSILEEIYEVRRELLGLRRAVWPLRMAINNLIRDGFATVEGSRELITPEVQVYLRDCYDHVFQILDILENYRELASSLMDVYLSSMSNKMNEIMKVLTIISTIFIPLTFIAGIYGMNFEYMPELQWEWGYYFCWLVMISLASFLIYFFWRRGWFDRVYPSKDD